MAGKMVCSHCESVISADSKFCPNCGAGFEPVEPEVNQFYPPSPPPLQTQSPLPVPPPPQYTKAPVQSGFAAPAAEPRKSKKIIYIIIAVVAVVLVCICVMGIIAILSFRATG